MVSSKATTVAEYLKELPEERRMAINAVRKAIKANLPAGYKEGMQYGMIGYFIPLKDFPNTYNGQPLLYAGLASQKNYLSLYLNNIFSDPKIEKWFKQRYAASGKKLKMGKSCVNFAKLDDLPMDLVGEVVGMTPPDEFLRMYKHARKTIK